MEPQREEERALKEAEELKKQIEKETAEDNTDVTEIEDEKINVESTDEPVEEEQAKQEEPETGEKKKEEMELTDEETNPETGEVPSEPNEGHESETSLS